MITIKILNIIILSYHQKIASLVVGVARITESNFSKILWTATHFDLDIVNSFG